MSDARDYEDAYIRDDGDYKQQRCPHGWVDIKQCRDCDNIKEIESLRQQLANAQEHCRDFAAQAETDAGIIKSDGKEIHFLRQQLADHIKREVMLREAATRARRKLTAYVGVCTGDKELTNTIIPMLKEALAATESKP